MQNGLSWHSNMFLEIWLKVIKLDPFKFNAPPLHRLTAAAVMPSPLHSDRGGI